MPLPLPFHNRTSKLHRAIKRDDADKVSRLLSREAFHPNAQSLKKAISSSSHSALEALLHGLHHKHSQHSEKSASRSKSSETLTPALHAAAASLDTKAISMLLANGANVRAVHKQKEPLHLVIRSSTRKRKPPEAFTETVSILVYAGALKGHFEEGLYPPNFAIRHGNIAALSAMLSHRSVKLSRSLRKYSTLRHACSHASLDAFHILFPHIDRH